MPQGHVALRKFKGVRLDVEPRDLEDDELAWSLDTWAPTPGELHLRLNTKQLDDGVSFRFQTHGNTLVALFTFTDESGYHRTILWTSSDEQSAGRGALLTPSLDLASPSSVIDLFEATGRPQFIPWQRQLFVFGENEVPGAIIFDGGNQQNSLQFESMQSQWGTGGSGLATDLPRPSIATVYQGSLLLAGFPGDDANTLRFCEPQNPRQLLVNTKALYIGRADGDRITGLHEVAVEGGSTFVAPYCLIFKRKSVWMMQGAAPSSTSAGTLSVAKVVQNEGCVAKETIAKTPHGIVWCSGENVWIAPSGGSPIKLGTALSEMLRKAPQDSGALWSAAYFNGIYRLNVPLVHTTQTSFTEGSLTLVPTATEQWWCDMREFPKVTWWGPMTIPAAAMHVDVMPDGRERLIGGRVLYPYDASAPADYPRFHLEEYDVMTPGRTDFYDSNALYSLPLSREIRLREIDFDDSALTKIIEGVELDVMHLIDAQPWSVTMYVDGASSYGTRSGGAGLTGFILDTSTLGPLGTTPLSRTFQTLKYRPESRLLARTVQPVITFEAVDDSNDSILRSVGIRIRPIGRRP